MLFINNRGITDPAAMNLALEEYALKRLPLQLSYKR